MPNVINNNSQPTKVFCDVALPAALPQVLTYRWSGDEKAPEVGVRVVVPLGKRRLTGVVWEVHTRNPEGYLVKDIEAVVDDRPVVTLAQIACMTWIAKHYMCTLGDVVSAALPSGMKLASKSRILLNPDLVKERNRSVLEDGLSNSALRLFDALQMSDGLNLKEVSNVLGMKHPQRIMSLLIDRGLAVSEEELKERYKAKKKIYVRILSEVLEEEDVLKAELERAEKRAPVQARVLLSYLELAPNGEAILKSVLQKRADVNYSVIKKWVDKNV